MTSDPTTAQAAPIPAAPIPAAPIPPPPAWNPAALPALDGADRSVRPGTPPPVPDPPIAVEPRVSLRGQRWPLPGAAQPAAPQPVPADTRAAAAPGPDRTGTTALQIAPPRATGRSSALRLVVSFVTLTAVLLAAGGLLLTLAGVITRRTADGGWLLFAVLLAAAITVHRASRPGRAERAPSRRTDGSVGEAAEGGVTGPDR